MMTLHQLRVHKTSSAFLLSAGLGLLIVSLSAVAAPFRDLPIRFTQPDGEKIALRGWGDEFYAVFETLDGYTVVFDPALKAYCYAQAGTGGNLVSSGVAVGRRGGASLGPARHLRMSRAVRIAQVRQRYAGWDQQMDITQRWKERKAALQQWGQQAGANGVTPKSPPPSGTTGSRLGLTLLIDFDDDPATIPQSDLEAFCNGDSYTAHGNNGSVKQYYHDVSNGLLTYSNVVTIYIRIPNSLHPKSYYNDTTKDCGVCGNYLIRDALNIMKALPNYTTDILPTFNNLTVANNQVVAFNVLYAGDNGNVWSMGLWPHSGSLSLVGAQSLSTGGKQVNRYQITNLGDTPTIGTFCHENGHMLCGYPDLYDYTGDSEGVGNWCLMGGGNWCGSPAGSNPSQISAYLKRASGWAATTALTSGSYLTATVANISGPDFDHFYRFQKPGTATEYFLAECRYKTGHDADLPGSGILVWHIDELGDNSSVNLSPNTSHNNYEATVVQADHLWEMEHGQNRGSSNDPYYQGNTASGYANLLSDSSNPNAHWWSGAVSGLKFSNFSARAATMTFVVGDPPPTANFTASPLIGAAALPVTFTDTSTGVITGRSWDFGDGSTLSNNTATTIQHLYVAAGVYSPTLTVTGPTGSTSTNRAKYITATNAAPVAAFAATPTAGLLPLTVQFANTSIGTYTNAQWTFGDGTTNVTIAPLVSKTYVVAGVYSVGLAIAGPTGSSTTNISNYIIVTNGPPIADFSASPTNGSAPLAVGFRNLSQGMITNAVWTFGDGSSANTMDALVPHTYALAGKYNVGLTLTSTGGTTVTNRPGYILVTNAAPEPAFVAGSTSGSALLTVFYFTNLSHYSTNYIWSFGDGTTTNLSTADAVAHTYSGGSNYTVCLTGTGLGGTRTTCSNAYILVTNPPSNVLAWGDSSMGQTEVPIWAMNCVTLAAGSWHSLALHNAGPAVTWGSDDRGESDAPLSALDAIAVAAGGAHTLAITPGGTIVGWGANDTGQLNVPAGLNQVLAIAAGTWHSVALREDGRVFVWGDNEFGQANQPTGLTNVVAVAAGGNHTLALKADGTVAAWGENTDAYGNTSGQSVVPWGLRNVVAIAAGDYHSLAVLADGHAVAWGDNSEGQCDVPVGLSNVVAAAAGGAHSVALQSTGTPVAWGADWSKQCTIPALAKDVVMVAAGESHTLALLNKGLPPPRLLSPTRKNGSTSFLLPTVQRKTYVLEYKSALADDPWTTLSTVGGNGALRVLTDWSPSVAQRFYRARTLEEHPPSP